MTPSPQATELSYRLHSSEILADLALKNPAFVARQTHFLREVAILNALRLPGLQIFIFAQQRHFLYARHMEGQLGFPALLRALIDGHAVSIGDHQVNFSNRSTIYLCHADAATTAMRYAGCEINLLLVDQARHFTEPTLAFLRARCRMPHHIVSAEYRALLPRMIQFHDSGRGVEVIKDEPYGKR